MHNGFLLKGGRRPELPRFTPRFPWVGPDLQTLKNTLHFTPPAFGAYPAHRLLLPLRDGSGDSLSAALNMPAADEGKPLIVLVHGLTGGEMSRNIQASAAYHLARGYPVLRLNLRNAGPSLGQCRHFYHAGRSEDLRDALAALPRLLKERGVFLIGVSLGGNVVLKLMAEGTELGHVMGAASVCAPIDLKAAQRQIMTPRNRLYQKHLLHCLIRDTLQIPGFAADEPMADLKTIFDFDDRIVAPLSGFEGADDYYRRCSSAPLLSAIKTPTFLITSDDDPWIPRASYLEQQWSSEGPLTFALTFGGGHVGFHGKGSEVPWHNQAIGAFLSSLH